MVGIGEVVDLPGVLAYGGVLAALLRIGWSIKRHSGTSHSATCWLA